MSADANVNTSYVNYVAFGTTVTFAAGTVAATLAAVTATTTVAIVAFAALAVISLAFMGSSMYSWCLDSSTDTKSYLSNVVKYAGYGIVVIVAEAAVTIFRAALDGLGRGVSNGVSNRVSKAISG